MDAGVEWWGRTRFQWAWRLPGGWLASLDRSGRESREPTRVLVGADGARSRVARALGLEENREWLSAAEEVYPDATLEVHAEVTKFPEVFEARTTDFRFTFHGPDNWQDYEFEIWGGVVHLHYPAIGKFSFEGKLMEKVEKLDPWIRAKYEDRTLEEIREEFVLEVILAKRPSYGFDVLKSADQGPNPNKVWWPPNVFEGLLEVGEFIK